MVDLEMYRLFRECFCNLSRTMPRYVPDTDHWRHPFDPMVWFLCYIVSSETLYKSVFPFFQIMSNHLNLPQVDTYQGLKKPQRQTREMEGPLNTDSNTVL